MSSLVSGFIDLIRWNMSLWVFDPPKGLSCTFFLINRSMQRGKVAAGIYFFFFFCWNRFLEGFDSLHHRRRCVHVVWFCIDYKNGLLVQHCTPIALLVSLWTHSLPPFLELEAYITHNSARPLSIRLHAAFSGTTEGVILLFLRYAIELPMTCKHTLM